MNSHTRTMAACLDDAEREAMQIGYVPRDADMVFQCDWLKQYHTDPAFRARMDTARDAHRNKAIADMEMALVRAERRWPAHWTEAEKAEATLRLMSRLTVDGSACEAVGIDWRTLGDVT